MSLYLAFVFVNFIYSIVYIIWIWWNGNFLSSFFCCCCCCLRTYTHFKRNADSRLCVWCGGTSTFFRKKGKKQSGDFNVKFEFISNCLWFDDPEVNESCILLITSSISEFCIVIFFCKYVHANTVNYTIHTHTYQAQQLPYNFSSFRYFLCYLASTQYSQYTVNEW